MFASLTNLSCLLFGKKRAANTNACTTDPLRDSRRASKRNKEISWMPSKAGSKKGKANTIALEFLNAKKWGTT